MENQIIGPILPLRDLVVYPSITSPLFVGRAKSIDAINFESLVFVIILGKTKKKDVDRLNKKLKYQKSLKIGYLCINT